MRNWHLVSAQTFGKKSQHIGWELKLLHAKEKTNQIHNEFKPNSEDPEGLVPQGDRLHAQLWAL